MRHFYFPFILSIFLFSTSCDGDHHKTHEEEEEEHHEHAGIALEPDKAAEFGIEFKTVAPGTFSDVIKTSGTIEPSSADVTTISAKRSGIITLNPGIGVGSSLTSGEKIGSISSEGIQGGDVNQAAIANLEAASKEYERLKPLYEQGLVTSSVFHEAERIYNEARALSGKEKNVTSPVTATSAGSLQNLYVSSGQYVEVGQPIATLVKNNNLVLRADLPARESKHLPEISTANFISEGNSQTIKLTELNGKKVSGTSSSVSNGYIPVYFSFTGSPLSYPGGHAEVFLICGERDGVISVPREALLEIQGKKYVYVAEDGHDYDKRLVETGASDGQRVEITKGLTEGERIVSKGASIMRMVEVSSVAPPAHTHNH